MHKEVLRGFNASVRALRVVVDGGRYCERIIVTSVQLRFNPGLHT